MANNTDAENTIDTANIGVTSAAPAPVALPYARPFPDVSNIEIFANKIPNVGKNVFSHCLMSMVLHMHCCIHNLVQTLIIK